MEIVPVTFKYAKQYIKENHRHNPNIAGCKFAIGLKNNNGICGVAVCGRPVSRYLDDGETLEINRVCTNGEKNACSKLYGACCRVAKEMGYKRVITYTLESEDGASVKASNFICDGEAGGHTLDREKKQGAGHSKRNESEMAQRIIKRRRNGGYI